MTRTDEEILEKVEAVKNSDWIGTIRSDLLATLPLEKVKPFLKEGATETYEPLSRDKDAVIEAIRSYMEFAWTKANHCRGLSAGRSMDHFHAWLWLLGEDEAAEALADYTLYGKPFLREICEHFGWDWRQWDNNIWVNSEDEDGVPADSVPPVTLPWKV